MKNYLFYFIIILYLTNCTLENVVRHHGVHFLDKKHTKLKVSDSNLNDVKKLLGPPSTENAFNNDIWVYIERKTTVSDIKTLGRKKLIVNNVLILEFDKRGMLIDKKFYDKNNLNELKIAKNETTTIGKKKQFLESILLTLNRKINDPRGIKSAK
jgi:outer membrane protein assembly factor BamE (lipoprotein component of BamABCDE complex)